MLEIFNLHALLESGFLKGLLKIQIPIVHGD
jgi:hypothetical protein